MKRTLFILGLLLVASVSTALAQGFRVYRSDGAVYQFSFVADSIAFYDGEGDPNYSEPVPEAVKNAIEELQWLCHQQRDEITENTYRIKVLEAQLNAINSCNCDPTLLSEQIAELKAICSTQQNDILSLQADNKDQDALIQMLQAEKETNQARISQLEAKTENYENEIRTHKTQIAELNAVMAELRAKLEDHLAQ